MRTKMQININDETENKHWVNKHWVNIKWIETDRQRGCEARRWMSGVMSGAQRNKDT